MLAPNGTRGFSRVRFSTTQGGTRGASRVRLSTTQKITVMVAAVFYIVADALHFIKPAPWLKIMPPYIPWHAAMVRSSGACEILGGLGLLLNATRRAAAWGLVALPIAVRQTSIWPSIRSRRVRPASRRC